jgi:Ca2+-dependent lipid-binding protein
MSVGPGDMSVGATVSNIIKSVIQDLMLYPKKLVIPVMEETDIRALANPAPVGVVSVTIIGAKDLAAFDVGGTSDPYVVIKLGPESAKTSYKSRTCNPEWGEEFDLLCHDVEIQTVTLSVFDYDAVGSDDLMGMCELILTALPPHKKVGARVGCTRLHSAIFLDCLFLSSQL